jgi:MoxR-like ATPase
LDRFMMKIMVDYPDFQAEKSILDLKKDSLQELKPILSTNDIQALQEAVNSVYVDEKIKDMVVRMVHATRPGNKYFLRQYEGAIMAGASPRACLWLYKIAKYRAFRQGKEFVTPEHILSIVPAVLGHRVILSYEANIDKINVRDVVLKIANSVV